MKKLTSALVIALAALVLPVLSTGTSGAQSGSTTKGCPSLTVLLLVDQSSSLRTTDPGALRVGGAESLIKSLSNSAHASGETINLGIAGFGEGAQLVGETTLPGQQAEATEAVQIFHDRNSDQNTDYVLALQFALQYFADRPGVPASCNRLVWFTDGAYSIDKLDAPGLATYTTSRDKRTIQNQLGEQICGPLPEGSQLGTAVSQSIQTAGFSVQMIDLRNEGSEGAQDRAERAQTAPVIDRLLGENRSDPCRVLGKRVEASQASSLETEFFKQGQIALGHFEIDCAQLDGGYPASMVNALAVKNSNVDEKTQILLDNEVKTEDQGFADYGPKSGPATTGLISVRSGAGLLESCFADLQASVSIQSEPAVFGKASRSYLTYKVIGAGSSSGDSGVSNSIMSVAAKVNGQSTDVEWDDASRSWRVVVPGPLTTAPSVEVTASANGWQGPAFKAPNTPIQLRNEPPPPTVSWDGPSTIEGTKVAQGNLHVSPAAESGGTLCVTFGTPSSSVETLSLTLSDPAELCRPDTEPFDLPATLATTSALNTPAELTLTYTSTYKPAGSASPIPIGGTQNVVFPPISLVKPADTGKIIIVAAILWVASMLFSYFLLVGLTNRHLRLPDPNGYRALRIPLVFDDAGLRRVDDVPTRMEDFTAVSGDRSKYRLDGDISLERRRTWNPYSRLSAFARPQTGELAALPSVSRGFGQRVETAIPFDEIVLVNANPATKLGTAVALVRNGVRAETAEESIDRALLGMQRHFGTMQATVPGNQVATAVHEEETSVPRRSSLPPRPNSPSDAVVTTAAQRTTQLKSSETPQKRSEPRLPPRPV